MSMCWDSALSNADPDSAAIGGLAARFSVSVFSVFYRSVRNVIEKRRVFVGGI